MSDSNKTRRHPTRAELNLLKVLWANGPSTVREVHDKLPNSDAGYTTVLKLLQIMRDKGLVKRDESRRAHVYSAAGSRRQTQKRMLRDFLNTVYSGSAAQLAEQALDAANTVDESEVARLRRSLDELEHRV